MHIIYPVFIFSGTSYFIILQQPKGLAPDCEYDYMEYSIVK